MQGLDIGSHPGFTYGQVIDIITSRWHTRSGMVVEIDIILETYSEEYRNINKDNIAFFIVNSLSKYPKCDLPLLLQKIYVKTLLF